MKSTCLQFLLTVLLLALLAACAPRSGEPAQLPEATPVSTAPVVAGETDYEQLLAALRADGLAVEETGTVEDPLFSGDGLALVVAGAPVSVYQFSDEAAAAAAAATVNPTGTIIGPIIVDWVDPPHFYRQGRLLGLYAGEDETVLTALAAALGEPFVVGESGFGPLPAPGEVEAPPATENAFFCPDLARRPALLLYVPEEKHVAYDPGTGATCALPLPAGEALMPQVGGEAFFYTRREGEERLVVYRLTAGGVELPLPATALALDANAYQNLEYLVSDDGSLIAWSISASVQGGNDLLGDLYVAPVATEAGAPVTALVSHEATARPEVLAPVRFSDDGSLLYYTIKPQGIGGSWLAFTGRYDNLYAVPTAGGEPALLFDCAELDLFLCLGDFQLQGAEVQALAYTDQQASVVVVQNGAGEEINRFIVDADYIGYPTLSPAGELIFYSALLQQSDSAPLPAQGTIHRVAPLTAPAEVLIAAPELLLPQRFLGGSGSLLVGYAFSEREWGLALVDMQGRLQPLAAYPTAMLVGLLAPTASPAGALPEHILPRLILEQATLPAPTGWQIRPCEGQAPVLCIGDGQQNMGYAELMLFSLAGYDAGHPVRVASRNLPSAGSAYTIEAQAAAREALAALAREHLETIAADRAITYPEDTFTPLEMEAVEMGTLPALAFGFVHTDREGAIVERYLNVAAFDLEFIYWLGANYDPAHVSPFVSDAALLQFAPAFLEVAAALPVPYFPPAAALE